MNPSLLPGKRKIQAYSILIMICIAVVVTITGFAYLYQTSLAKTKLQLQELVRAQARIAEAVAKFGAIVSGSKLGRFARAGTLSQLKEAHLKYTGFGQTGELVLAERVGNEIVFLLPTRKKHFEIPAPVAWDSSLAEPMRLALEGRAGTVEALDHSGGEVLAAYEYLPFLEMGLVAKMDFTEIREPFLKGALYTSIFAWVAIVVGALINIRMIGPLVKALFETNETLEQRERHLANLAQQLSKYLSPQLYRSIFEGRQAATIGTKRKKLTIFFSDIVGFTARTDRMEPEDLSTHLNSYLNRMANIVLKHGGTLDKFIGDAVLVFFGDPESQGVQGDAIACVEMALEMQSAVEELKQEWQKAGIETDFAIRMGITTGYCAVGNFGSEIRMDYTIIGNQVNLASRLESSASPGDILTSQETYVLIKDHYECREVESVQAKGFPHPIRAFQIKSPRQAANGSALQEASTGFRLTVEPEQISMEQKPQVILALKRAIQLLDRT